MLLSLVLALTALSDLTSLAPGDALRHHWDLQAPIRLAAFMGVCGWAYVRKSKALGGGAGSGRRYTPLTTEEERSVGVCNGLVFAWAFVEMTVWFMIYIKLREESREVALRRMQEMKDRAELEEKRRIESMD